MCLSATVFGQANECEKFKNGKFKIVDPETGNSIINRQGSRQTEYGEKSKLELAFKVEWLDECTYTLDLDSILANPRNLELPEGMVLTIEIIETKENSYRQKTSSNLFDLVVVSELIKIE